VRHVACSDTIPDTRYYRSELNATKLHMIHKRRTKEEQLKDDLPSKDERVVFCSMTKVQMAIYEHILNQPDFVCIKNSSALCDCGVNAEWCKRFLNIADREKRLEFQRRNRRLLKTKGSHCYSAPFVHGSGEEGDPIHPDAIIWKRQHPDSEMCERCPHCCTLPAMTVLSKVCSHASLIQVDRHNASGKSPEDFEYAKEMARVSAMFVPINSWSKSSPRLVSTLGIYSQGGDATSSRKKYLSRVRVLDR
jgi:SNF2 family DNA or RNA helicase